MNLGGILFIKYRSFHSQLTADKNERNCPISWRYGYTAIHHIRLYRISSVIAMAIKCQREKLP